MLFTILLKASTVLIDIDPKFWDYLSGIVLILFGITLIFPKLWSWLMIKTGIESWSQKNLESSSQKEGIWWPIGMGAALGPVFSSCAPTYGLLIATILPLDITSGLIGLTFYFIGLGSILLLITIFGRSILGKFRFFANPSWAFRKVLGVLVLLIGLMIVSGTVKKIQTWVVENWNFPIIVRIEEILNDQIDTSDLQKWENMCTGGNCEPQWKKESDISMDILQAPEIRDIAHWINSEPLSLESLKGKVVLIDFWTYSCINCIRTQPYLNAWHEKYEKDGLVIIGIHAPEFAFEKVESNVREASKKAGIKYPVALDNDFATWNAYGNRYWPAKYLIDQNGIIVYKHFGEGNYTETELKIQELLWAKKELEKEIEKSTAQKTPETYLGSSRGKIINPDNYVVKLHEWQAFGNWKQEWEYIEAIEEGQLLRLNFRAKDVYVVVSWGNWTLETSLYWYFEDGRVVKLAPVQTQTINVTKDDIYRVANTDEFGDHTLQIIASPWLRLHAFTFWS